MAGGAQADGRAQAADSSPDYCDPHLLRSLPF
jgi:hypothetical protein